MCVLGLIAPPISAQGARQPVIQLRGAETLGIGTSPSKAPMAKVGADLMALHAEYQAYLKETSGRAAAAPAFESRNAIAPVAGGSVVIDAVTSGNPEALAADLRALGADRVTVFGHMVSGRLPITAIPALKDLSALQFARPAWAATHAGDVTSQGDAAMGADSARATFGVDGTGVKVGVLSDSYNCLGGAPAGVASDDLPVGVNVLEEGPCEFGFDEGRALAEIVHDVAPGAAIAFHSAFNGQANFAQGIIDLANAGAKVITDDVVYFAEPFYQDGIVAQAVDTVKGSGVAYFSSAGNQARKAYESPFRPSGQFSDIGFGPSEAHDFDPGAGVHTCQQITIPVGRTLILGYQWDQPFASVSGAPGSASDIDIVLTNAVCDTLLAGSVAGNVGGDPVELFGFSNGGPDTTFGVIILRFSGPDPGLMKTVLFGSSAITINEFDTSSGASFGHNSARGGLGVGAADYRKTPAFEQDPPLIESFSSAGGGPILFNTAGTRLASPEVRQQPDITAPDGADTTFFGGSDTDGTGFPNFFGTSAAAPHAAGVAALMMALKSSLTPDELYSALKATAIDMDDPSTGAVDTGFDFGTGFGLIQADAALNAINENTAQADLGLTNTTSPNPVTVGQVLTYTLTAINNGPSDATGVTITDSLPAGVSFVSANPNCTGTNTIRCSIGDLGSEASTSVSISVKPNDAGPVVNTATVSANEADLDPANNSAGTTTTVENPNAPKVDLSITMSGTPNPATAHQPLTYTLTVRNNGPQTATSVEVTDTLPTGVAFVRATGGSCRGNPTVTCVLGTLTNGASAGVTIEVIPTEAGAVTNKASVISNLEDLNPGNNAATATIPVNPLPTIKADLSLTMADSPDPGAVGERLTYTLTVTNNGPGTATSVQVTDSLPTAVETGALTGNCRGNRVVVCDLGTLASGASAIVPIEVIPVVAGPVTNEVVVNSNVNDPVSGNNRVSASTTINPSALVLPPQGRQNTCTGRRCQVQLTCVLGTTCTNRVTLFARAPSGRLASGSSRKAARRIPFASASVANVPPGQTMNVTLQFTKRGRQIVRQLLKSGTKRLNGRIDISRSFIAGVSSMPATVRLSKR